MARQGKKRIVIIGNSAAALSALQTFRKKDQESKVLLIDREPLPAYSRVITPYFIMAGLRAKTDSFSGQRIFIRNGMFRRFSEKRPKGLTRNREPLSSTMGRKSHLTFS